MAVFIVPMPGHDNFFCAQQHKKKKKMLVGFFEKSFVGLTKMSLKIKSFFLFWD